MADKMMRMAGRGEDGLAKALSTDNIGRLNTNTNAVRNLTTEGVPLSTAELEWESAYFSADGYLSATIMLQMSHPRRVEIYIRKIRRGVSGYVEELEYKKLFRSTVGETLYSVDTPIDSGYFQIKVKLIDGIGGNIEVGSRLVMSSSRFLPEDIMNLGSGLLTLEKGASKVIDVFNAPVKQFIIGLSSDGGTDLTAGDGIKLGYVEFFDKPGLNNNVRLIGPLLDSAQPQIVFNNPISSGITTMIPNLSPTGFNIRLQNLTGKTVTFKYMITGYN